MDKIYNGEKAYGPARAKYLAKMTSGGTTVAYANNGNYIYFAISMFMESRWGEKVTMPKASWKGLADASITEPFPYSSVDDDDDGPPITGNGELIPDEKFYGGDSCESLDDCKDVCPVSRFPSLDNSASTDNCCSH